MGRQNFGVHADQAQLARQPARLVPEQNLWEDCRKFTEQRAGRSQITARYARNGSRAFECGFSGVGLQNTDLVSALGGYPVLRVLESSYRREYHQPVSG